MRVNSVSTQTILMGRKAVKNNNEQSQTQPPVADTQSLSFKAIPLNNNNLMNASRDFRAKGIIALSVIAALVGFGTALTMQNNEDVKEGKYDMKDVFGDKGEYDRTMM